MRFSHNDPTGRNPRLTEKPRVQHTQPLVTSTLSPREAEVGSWLAEGKSNPEIAQILGANVRTVEKHMERILQKLGVEHRAAAAVIIAQSRLAPSR